MHLKRLDLIGLHLTGLHLIRSYISQNVYLRCLYLMGVALLAGTHLTGVHLEAAVPKPAAPELCPRPISCSIVSPESTRRRVPVSAPLGPETGHPAHYRLKLSKMTQQDSRSRTGMISPSEEESEGT
jgi:hypothetical protein